MLTHVETYDSIWSNTHSQNFMDFVKELRGKAIQNKKIKKKKRQKMVGMTYRRHVKLQTPVLGKSGDKIWKKVAGES